MASKALGHFAHTVVPQHPKILKHRVSLRLAIDQVATILNCKKLVMPRQEAAMQLRKEWAAWMTAYKDAYGSQYLRPKSHWASHLPDLFEQCFLDMFVIERMNKQVKAASSKCVKTLRSEKTTITAYLMRHLGRLRDMTPFGHAMLQGGVVEHAVLSGIDGANKVIDTTREMFAVGGFVLSRTDGSLGEILT